jgi:hypothetical protein
MTKKRKLPDHTNAVKFLLAILLLVFVNYLFASSLESEAEIVLDTLTNGDMDVNLLESNELDDNRVRLLDRKDYEEVKGMLGVKNEFCIYFEDEDGEIVEIEGIGNGIGSSKIQINGEPCS